MSKRILFCAVFTAAFALCLTSCHSKNKEAQEETDSIEMVSSPEFESGNTTSDDDSEASDEVAEESSSQSEDWDAVLDEYEGFVNSYIKLMKKATAGDASAMAEYPKMMEKAEKLGDKLENAEGDMTSAQWNRYLKILNKMTSIAE